MPDETPTNPPDQPDDNAAREIAEFAWYKEERAILTKVELETEKNYDTLLVTLSTLAIGASFALMQVTVRSSFTSAWLVVSWIAFGLCLLISLVDRLMSYWTHLWLRERMDAQFDHWSEGAKDRALDAHRENLFIKLLRWLKWVSFVLIVIGIFSLMIFAFAGAGEEAMESPKPPMPIAPIVVNVYNGFTPTTAPTLQVIH
jgi:hypothetical protein